MKGLKYLLLISVTMLSLSSFAQQMQEERRSKTPLLFPEFVEAKVGQPFGRFTRAKINFFLRDGSLLFMDEKGAVRKAYVKKILNVQVGDDLYLKVDSIFGKVMATQNYNYLVCVTTIDSKTYDQELTDINMMLANGGGLFKNSIMDLEERTYGSYPLKDTYYYVINGTLYPARHTAVKKLIQKEFKEAYKNITETHDWSWHDAGCLKQLLMYF